MGSETGVEQGTLAWMILKPLERAGSLQGYGIARLIEQTSAKLLPVNRRTLYPVLLKPNQESDITSAGGDLNNNRTAIPTRFSNPKEGLA